jgi:hypothetical protein
MGHASIAITYDRYCHLMPGDEAEAAGLRDAYLAALCLRGATPETPPAHGLRRFESSYERLAGLQYRLEVAQHPG